MIDLDPNTAALVLIDLQNGIVGMDVAPRSGEAVVAAAKGLAARFRAAGAPVVLVNVAFSADGGDAPRQRVDQPNPALGGPLPEGWSDLVPGLAQPGDIRITKRHWGAFHGTELDLQLRRRGRTVLVIAGIATNIGVESTARAAWEHGYEVVIAEDATTSRSAEMHQFAVQSILPLIARLAPSAEIAFA